MRAVCLEEATETQTARARFCARVAATSTSEVATSAGEAAAGSAAVKPSNNCADLPSYHKSLFSLLNIQQTGTFRFEILT